MALSGFPEWSPGERIIELAILDAARSTFELHGFSSLETRSVEPLDVLLRKGEIDKEVYGIRRLAGDDDSDLALHFDLTVPLARYVVENSGRLEFPFRRYQIQKVWRGERPQEGRFREFVQADIDIIGRDTLAFHHETEMALVMSELLAALPIPRAVIHVSNRKLAQGFYRGLGIDDPAPVLRAVDKIDKVGADGVRRILARDGLGEDVIDRILGLAAIRGTDTSFVGEVVALGVSDELLDEGIAELAELVSRAGSRRPGSVIADLRIARGLDYYTGTVFETFLAGHEAVGSISSGGRYDSLASDGRVTYPGVGISLGVTRLVSIVVGRGLTMASRQVPTAVLVAVVDEAHRDRSDDVAATLRARGIPCEVSPSAAKFGKQIRYADRRGIPFVWFPGEPDSVKDIRTGDQADADATSWTIPPADLWPQVRPADETP